MSTLLIHVALKNPQALRKHMRLFVRYTFLKLSTKALTRLWIEMRRLVKAFAISKLKYRHIQRPTPKFRPQDPPAGAYIQCRRPMYICNKYRNSYKGQCLSVFECCNAVLLKPRVILLEYMAHNCLKLCDQLDHILQSLPLTTSPFMHS